MVMFRDGFSGSLAGGLLARTRVRRAGFLLVLARGYIFILRWPHPIVFNSSWSSMAFRSFKMVVGTRYQVIIGHDRICHYYHDSASFAAMIADALKAALSCCSHGMTEAGLQVLV